MAALEEKQHIGRLFDRIASTYDRFNHLLSLGTDRRWRRKAVHALQQGCSSVLDVAVGTGDLAIEALQRGKADHVTGIDLSGQMMAIGRQKADRKGLGSRIDFIAANAQEMPFDDGSFDAVTCAFGVRNFSDLDKGLGEMCRVLRSGGQVVILEFSYPGNRLVRAVYDLFFTNVMPLVGRLVSKDPSAYIYFRESVKGFIWGEQMARRIAGAGFGDVSFKPLTFGIATIYTARKS